MNTRYRRRDDYDDADMSDNDDKDDRMQEEEDGKKEEQDAESRQYFEDVDIEKEGLYYVKDFDPYTRKIRWRISEITKTKVVSPVFEVGGCKWSILCFPRGNNVNQLSLYLSCEEETKEAWVRYARFQLTALNYQDVTKSVTQDAEKRFNNSEKDWGFREFIANKKLYNRQEGFLTPENHIILECVIHVVHEPHLLNPHNYNSKQETGFVGMKNQGATCYLNSLLQTLYHVAYFRRSVYKMPIDPNETPSSSIPLALQRVFWRLQYENDAIDTKELTKSFGWDTIDSFLQHDVQELARVLCDNLEKKMENTSVKGTMKYLLEGVCKNYIRCINVDYESSRKETFYDLQLNVKDCADVYRSFDQYIEEETLEGDNKYQAEGFGYQDAKKGCIFMSFPPVLMLHLKRFEYDIQRDMMYKINERYDYPTELDLSKYLADDSEQKNQDNRYTLFSVLVHSGDVSGGHYYAFIKSYADEDQWYKFDDERVYKVQEKDAVFENYGGTGDEPKSKYFWKQSATPTYKKYTNAYMLVYIRTSEAAQLLQRVEASDVPEHLQQRFEQERAEKEKRKLEKAEAWKYCQFKIATNQHLAEVIGQDLGRFEQIEPIKIKKDATLADLKLACQERFGIPAEKQRFWKWAKRQNKTYRPDAVVKQPDMALIDRVFDCSRPYSNEIITHNLFLEQSSAGPDEEPFNLIERDDALIFFKFYDPEHTKLSFVGNTIMKTRQHNGDMIPICCEMLGLDPDTPLQMYEEVRQSMVEPLDPMRTLAKSELQTGDIVVFQFPVKDPYMYQLATAKEYFSYLTNRIDVTIHKLEDPKGEGITIELLKNAKYETIVNQIGRHPSIGVEGQYVRLTAHSTYGDGGPRDKPVKTADAKTLKEMLPQAAILYYEILSVPIQEIESKKELEVAVVGRNNALITSLKLLMDKKATIGDLKKVVLEKVEREEPIRQLRILDVYNHKIHKVFEDGYHVGNITTENTDVVAEEIVEEDATLKRIQVQHFCKEQQSTRVFGFPFHIYVSPTETVKEVKEKIQQRLGVKDEDFKRYKFTILAGVVRNTYLNDDDILAEIAEKESSYKTESVLGMEHKDPTPRTSTNRWYDKPIVIKN